MEISIKEVTKWIRKKLILDHVNMTLVSGKLYGLQGPNGSGKTMLLRLIAGLILPTEGEVWIDGKKLGKEMDFPPSMGLMIENPAFLPNFTGLKNLELLAEIKGKASEEEIRQAILDAGLNPDDKRTFSKYSLGMKQRLGIASCLMEKPDLILLDEPTNALDEKGVDEICKIIQREKERGALIVIASHDADILEGLADDVYLVNEGKVSGKNLSVMESRFISP